MAIRLFPVVVVLLLKIYCCHAQSLDESSYSKSCVIDSCSACFNRLAYETVYEDQNQLSLQRAFYPPDDAPPVFVIVSYNYSYPDGEIADYSETWFWSASTYYLFQPLRMLQFTSLFFADPEFRTKRLTIILPTDCINVSETWMQLLTQRLQLFAQTRDIYPSISSDYQPKADNGNTLKAYFEKEARSVKYLFASQFILYIFCLAGTPIFIFYLLFGFPFRIHEYITENYDKVSNRKTSNDEKPNYWEKDTLILAGGVLSWIFWLYATIMSSLGVYYQSTLPPEFQDIHNNNEHPFRLLYGITILILVQNIFTPIYYFVVYLVTILIYRKADSEKFNFDPDTDKEWKIVLELVGVLSLSLPITTVIVHFTHIVIGFIHNEYHATSVAFFYGVVLVLHVIMFKTLTHLYYTHFVCDSDGGVHLHAGFFVVSFSVSSVVLNFFVAFVAALYLLLPINNAFDEAPNRLNTLFSSLIVAFSGYIAFLLYEINKNQKGDNS